MYYIEHGQGSHQAAADQGIVQVLGVTVEDVGIALRERKSFDEVGQGGCAPHTC
jgi:hypothetical protein